MCHTWHGSFLNWLTMRRTDIMNKLLTGSIDVGGGGSATGYGSCGNDNTLYQEILERRRALLGNRSVRQGRPFMPYSTIRAIARVTNIQILNSIITLGQQRPISWGTNRSLAIRPSWRTGLFAEPCQSADRAGFLQRKWRRQEHPHRSQIGLGIQRLEQTEDAFAIQSCEGPTVGGCPLYGLRLFRRRC